jgi:hypothetical protein
LADQFKGDMGIICGHLGDKYMQSFGGVNLKGEDHFEELGVSGW